MKDWWKNPVLQGPENDYGDYDYLVEELPDNVDDYTFDIRYKWHCDECGGSSHLIHRQVDYFYCWDGYDSMSWYTCWRCEAKGAAKSYIRRLKGKVRR